MQRSRTGLLYALNRNGVPVSGTSNSSEDRVYGLYGAKQTNFRFAKAFTLALAFATQKQGQEREQVGEQRLPLLSVTLEHARELSLRENCPCKNCPWWARRA